MSCEKMGRIFAPTGLNMSAQGNALGNGRMTKVESPERGIQNDAWTTSTSKIVSPLQG
jgi:hypothetical protein